MKNLILISSIPLLILACSPKPISNTNVQSSEPAKQGDGTNTGGTVTPPPAPTPSALEKLKTQSNEYRAKFSLNDAFSKLVDNHGDKFANLYGVRNFRVVLHGVYYRGGANNSYNSVDGVRNNENPLPKSGLKNLCEEGFKESIYLYSTNFSTSPVTTSCRDDHNADNTLKYEQISPLSFKNNDKFIEKVFQVIRGQRQGPIYGHCWNGWHASGFVSAILLKQFCGYSDAKAVDYWVKNTDGNSNGYDTIKNQIAAFQPIAKFQISKEESALICP